MHLRLCFLLFIAALLPATAGAQGNWITANKAAYRISYPPDWELDESGKYGTKFYIFSPLRGETDEFRENIGLVTEDLGNNKVDLAEYIDISKKNLPKFITNATIQSCVRLVAHGQPYYRLVYIGDQGNYHLKFDAIIYLRHQTAYVVTFVAEKAEYARYKTTVDKMMESFEVL
ncbi:MAG: hypothetical protein EBZ77_05830 [Chitinophagia bacterium]|nr:hypothetical protein [Chitinophagia bacterium]